MADPLFLTKLLIDACLVIVILMVQLTVYPSFLYFKRENLVNWHKKYTTAIAAIVGPLMVVQLFLSVYFVVVKQQYFLGGMHLLLVLGVWLSTSVLFVPLHNKIANDTHTEKDLLHLVQRNWARVVLWILILSTSLAASF